MRIITIDTLLVLDGRKETVFRHLEDGRLRLIRLLTHTDAGKERAFKSVEIVSQPGMVWYLSATSFDSYARRQNVEPPTVCYDE
jgi:hypothetical protein